MQKGFAVRSVLSSSSCQRRIVYCYLHERANEKGECWPAIATIAHELKLSRSTVKRAITDLKKADCIETEQRYRTKGGKSSLMFLIK